MEGIGSEVSQKIRAAIKAKLIELGAYVDDELPDYIMVMVANKRTKSQMDEDLQLFLTSNTKIFTSWLHTVLQKLQEVTVANFEGKKNTDGKKTSKKKKSESSNISQKKSSDEFDQNKKHIKKYKEGKKTKKNKHKSKEKTKTKSGKEERKEKLTKEMNVRKPSHDSGESVRKTIEENSEHINIVQLNKEVDKVVVGNMKKNKTFDCEKDDFLNSSYFNKDTTGFTSESTKDNIIAVQSKTQENLFPKEIISNSNVECDTGGFTMKSDRNMNQLIEDEFNIEPLKPSEKFDSMNESFKSINEEKEPYHSEIELEKTVSAPTEELLKKHNKILNEKFKGEELKEKKNVDLESDESVSPEEMRKQLLLSRAKKKLENSKLADRMRSNSPDVLIVEECNGGISKDLIISSRYSPPPLLYDACNRNSLSSPMPKRFSSSTLSSHPRKPSPESSSQYKNKEVTYKCKEAEQETKQDKRKSVTRLTKERKLSSLSSDFEVERKHSREDQGKKKNVIKISESLELERNFGIKKENEKAKVKENENLSKRKLVSSRVVTITGPEAPEISSIVKVKPREYIAKDKQANKALILKAVADAEKSIATIHARIEPEPEIKKEALFTKNLRCKRYEKLAVTLSNIRKSPDHRERSGSKLGSEKSDKSQVKRDSSEISECLRGKSDLQSRKMSKSEDQFISSKTSVMEKNDMYIRCWLEGVEKAVKDDEMVNPNDMEDRITHCNFTDEENESNENDLRIESDKKKKKLSTNKLFKNQKLTDQEIANLRLIPDSKTSHDGPQIVVTLDGLDSKVIKDIILRNKEIVNGPILSSKIKYSERKLKDKISQGIMETEKKNSIESRNINSEKISDRFGRLNKTNKDFNSEKLLGSKTSVRLDLGIEKKKNNASESKNKQLIAQLSEKFGKVDREFESKKRKYPEEERKYSLDLRKNERDDFEKNEKNKKSERKSIREASPLPSKFSSSSQVCKFYPNCKNYDCRYFHPKKCRFNEDCTNPDCKYVHAESRGKKKFRWYSNS